MSYTQERNQVAREILQQLGGNKFLAMTGAHKLGATETELHMTLRRNQSGANKLVIGLTSMDTYQMRFLALGKNGITEIETLESVYADQLQEMFTWVTGMDTSL